MSSSSSVLLPHSIVFGPSPSFEDGIDAKEELLHRSFGGELLQDAGRKLRLNKAVAATAQNIMHRFMYRQSLKKFDIFTIAMGAMLLASKVEENPKEIRDVMIFLMIVYCYYLTAYQVILVFHRIYQRRNDYQIKNLDISGEQYNKWKSELMIMERNILKELGFSFYNIADHPHKYILYFIKVVEGDRNLAQCAWNYLNDSLRLDLCLKFRSEVIACAAIFMAIQKINFPVEIQSEWWKIMGATITEILDISERILELYEMPKITWLNPLTVNSYLSSEQSLLYETPKSYETQAKSSNRNDSNANEIRDASKRRSRSRSHSRSSEDKYSRRRHERQRRDRSSSSSNSRTRYDSRGENNKSSTRRRSRSPDDRDRKRIDNNRRNEENDRGDRYDRNSYREDRRDNRRDNYKDTRRDNRNDGNRDGGYNRRHRSRSRSR